MLTQVYIHLGVALAGLVSFLSPCVLPLVPPYLGYISGTTIEQMTDKGGVEDHVWRRVVLASLLFVSGFTTVFVALGAGVRLLFVYSLGLGVPFILAAAAIGPFIAFLQRFRQHLRHVEMVMGVLLVLTGVLMLTGSLNWFGQWLIENVPVLARIEEAFTPKQLQTEILKEGAK